MKYSSYVSRSRYRSRINELINDPAMNPVASIHPKYARGAFLYALGIRDSKDAVSMNEFARFLEKNSEPVPEKERSIDSIILFKTRNCTIETVGLYLGSDSRDDIVFYINGGCTIAPLRECYGKDTERHQFRRLKRTRR